MQKNYRADIDGLRAIAILLVLFFHLRLPFAQAGFLGVDVFFVISGFLITTHIVHDIENKRFSIWRFYTKRIRRIMPALLVVLVFSTLAACFILLPIALNDYARSAFSAVSFSANYYFLNFIKIGYFSTNAKDLPLLHTWSLSVEEQFYLVGPIILFGCFFLLKRIGLKLIISCLFLVSVALYATHLNQHQWLFYSPFTRAFELLTGSLLAIWRPKRPHHKFINHSLSVIGLAMILLSGCCLIPSDFPSAWVALPLIGAALLIYSRSGVANRLLSLKPIVFIGLISYSLYLWHWPIIAYVNYLNLSISPLVAALICIASILLATLTWQFVEKPLRYKFQMSFLYSLLCYVIYPLILAFAFLLFVTMHPNIGYNQANPKVSADIQNGFYGKISPNTRCFNTNSKIQIPGSFKNCLIGEQNKNNIQALLTGDSHAMAAQGLINILLRKKGLTGYIVTQGATPFFLGQPLFKGDLPKVVSVRNKLIKNLIRKNHYKYVIVGGFWSDPLYTFKEDPNAFKAGLIKTIEFVIQNHATPVILQDVPPLLSSSPQCGFDRINWKTCGTQKSKVLRFIGSTRQVIQSLKEKFPQLIIIDPFPIICQKNRCVSSLERTPLYFDSDHYFFAHHLNYAGATLLGKMYLKRYGNPF